MTVDTDPTAQGAANPDPSTSEAALPTLTRAPKFQCTDRVLSILRKAEDGTRAAGEEIVSPARIFLSLVSETAGVAASILVNLKVDRGALAYFVRGVDSLHEPKDSAVTSPPLVFQLPYSDEARRVLNVLAYDEASMLSHSYVGTEHLLPALLRSSDVGIKMAVEKFGLDVEKVRVQTRLLLSMKAA